MRAELRESPHGLHVDLEAYQALRTAEGKALEKLLSEAIMAHLKKLYSSGFASKTIERGLTLLDPPMYVWGCPVIVDLEAEASAPHTPGTRKSPRTKPRASRDPRS